jgi:hypothetical protein
MFRLANCPYGFHVLIYDGCKSTFEHPVYLFEMNEERAGLGLQKRRSHNIMHQNDFETTPSIH